MSISELNTQLEYLAETKEQIKTAITNKGQDITNSVPFREYVDKINNISTLQVDTADANALTEDIVAGKIAYVKGEKVSGNVQEITAKQSMPLMSDGTLGTYQDEHQVSFMSKITDNLLFRENSLVEIKKSNAELATQIELTPDKLIEGSTVLDIQGTASSGSGQVSNFVETTLNYTQPINSIPQEISLSATIEANIGDYVKLKYNIPLGEDYGTESGQCGILIGKVISNVENTLRLNIIQKYTAMNLAGGLSCGLDHIVTDTGYDGSFMEIYSIEQQNGPAYFETPTYEIIMSPQMSEVAAAIGLTADKITSGNTILGIEGTATTGIDTSDATATSGDLAINKTAYVNGEKITGSLLDLSESSGYGLTEDIKLQFDSAVSDYTDENNTALIVSGKPNSNIILKTNKSGSITIDFETLSAFIGLTPEKLVSGNRIIGVEGTAIIGLDTSDANAIAEDISINKTAYVNGQKIIGTLPLFPNTRTFTVSNAGVTNNIEDSTLDLTTINTTKQILDSNVSMNFNADYSDIATAIGLTADKIVEGNTILGIEGTATTGTTADIIIAQDEYGLETATSGEGDNDIGYKFFTTANTQSKLYNIGSMVELHITNELLAQILGITADKIKKDEVICGITGTYEGAGA